MKIIEKILDKYYEKKLLEIIRYDLSLRISDTEKYNIKKIGNRYCVKYKAKEHIYVVYDVNTFEGLSNLIYYITEGSKEMWERINKIEKENK